jgi:hypothetical protein
MESIYGVHLARPRLSGPVRDTVLTPYFSIILLKSEQKAKKKRKFGSIFVHVNKRDAEVPKAFAVNIFDRHLLSTAMCGVVSAVVLGCLYPLPSNHLTHTKNVSS